MRMSTRKGPSNSFKKLGSNSTQFSALSRLECINRLKNINGVLSVDWSNRLSANRSCHVVLFHFRFPKEACASDEQQYILHNLAESLHIRISEQFNDTDTFQIEKDSIVTVFYGTTREKIASFINTMKPMLQWEKLRCHITITVGMHSVRYNELGAAYEQVQEMAKQANLTEETQVIDKLKTTPPLLLSPKHEQTLSSFLQSGNAEGAMQMVSQLIDHFVESRAAFQAYQHLANLTAAKVWVNLEPLHLEAEAVEKVYTIIKKLYECGTVQDYLDTFTELFEQVAAFIKDSQKYQDPIAALVMDILHTRYSQDLSLAYLSQLLTMSPAYLSVYIKEKTGANFSDHLNEIRIRKAKELLIVTEMSIQDISMQVGYTNITSFNRMFKKQIGMSPGEYRKQQISQIHQVK
ncbi:helix-turn-helix domain-containing protein [Paenibacillus sp. YAF4_2]|uniref:helix-turn-helix domain-containing protein n=1 Tax=Paenibacillus sp. YAF4_2 TaxID=3233085 RepID=UPI003F9B6AB6